MKFDEQKIREAVEKIKRCDVFHTTINEIHNEIIVLKEVADAVLNKELVEPMSVDDIEGILNSLVLRYGFSFKDIPVRRIAELLCRITLWQIKAVK